MAKGAKVQKDDAKVKGTLLKVPFKADGTLDEEALDTMLDGLEAHFADDQPASE